MTNFVVYLLLTIQGGVSTDMSGVEATGEADEWFAGPDLQVTLPTTASVDQAWAYVVPTEGGVPAGYANCIRINGHLLGKEATLEGWPQVFSLDPAAFGITGPGSYSYEECGLADATPKASGIPQGIAGTGLVVVYEDLSLPGVRQVAWAMTNNRTSATLTGLTSQATPEALISLIVEDVPSDAQDARFVVDGTTLTEVAGGADDTPDQEAGAVGDLGFGDDGLLVSVDGDDPDAEPASGTHTNSRLSDELFRVPYDNGGELELSLDSDQVWGVVVVLDLDLDGDGVADAEDDCPELADDQTDTDGDGLGDACDPCNDADEDGYGAAGDECDEDCDDADSEVHPGANEVAYDGVDNDCDPTTLDDDLDEDGFGADQDCNDGDPDIFPGAEEVPDDGVDQDCDGEDAHEPADTGDTGDASTTYHGSCGCASSGAPGLLVWLLLPVALLRRRRHLAG